ncbi:MAG: mitochondrial fission ELM1 family protein [Rhodospirillales bacterium]|nr:mitochondrial fission ELM1 family protein [Rhodospirillales bacterium]
MNRAGEDKAMQPPPRVWVLAGHKAGDNAQLTALATALGWPFEVKRLAYRKTELATNLLLRVTLAGTVLGRSTPLGPPWPDLVLTAGRRNEPVARWIKSASGGAARLVHVGRPWAGLACFDLVVTTPQYFVPARPNVLTVGMPLHGVTPQTLQSAASEWDPRLSHLPRPRIAVLIGGSSPPYRFGAEEAAELGQLVADKAARAGGSLLVTTSARTAPEAALALQAEMRVPSHFHRWQAGAADNPYRGFLALADEIVVTGDSISMLAEATATGKPVSIFDLGGMRETKPRALSSARDRRSLLHLLLMRVAPRRLRRDVRTLLQAAVASDRAAWLGDDPATPSATPSDDLPRAVEAVRQLFRERLNG